MNQRINQTRVRGEILALIFLSAAVFAANSQTEGYLDKPPELLSHSELWQEYLGWREAGDISQAHRVATQLAAAIASKDGKSSVEYGRALAEIGATDVLLGRHDEALQNLTEAEALLRDLPLYSEQLISPLTYLGAALHSAGRYHDAFDAFTRAQHISHRLWGNNNPAQIKITYAKASSILAMGEILQAEELYRFALKLTRINYGASSPQAIEAAAHLGTWLRSMGDYNGSISHFHQSLTELQGDGPDLPEAFPLLLGFAHAYRGGYRGQYARGMYQRILELMTAHPDRFTAEQRIATHLDFGDWLMQRYYESKATRQYLAAWQVANQSGARQAHWIEALATPKMVRYGGMAPHDIGGEDQFVRFRFNLTADGRPRRVKVIEQATNRRARYDARGQFPKEIRYRPAIIDGQPVALTGQTTTMYLLPPNTLVEPKPVAAPAQLAGQVINMGPENGPAGQRVASPN